MRLRHRLALVPACLVALVLPVAAPAAGFSPSSPSVASAASSGDVSHGVLHPGVRHAVSGNWAGWDTVGRRYTSVSATWVQPAIRCSLLQASYVSFWVGLDGDGSPSVQQTGTQADCSTLGARNYSGWYEFYPAPPVYYSEPVRPGDVMTASVRYLGSDRFRLVLRNATRGWTKVKDGVVRGARLTSAEVIAEAPSSGLTGRVLPLANFDRVTFTNATVNGLPLGKVTRPQPITMASGTVVKAVPSALANGNRFTVTWKHR